MEISGLQKTTLLDFPGKIACTVFLAGCNLRCPFCHNPSLVTDIPEPQMTQGELLAFLQKRRGILDGVCITGGEPTLRPDLPELIQEIRQLGFAVKLDTNGTAPKMLEQLLRDGLLDYTAMDIKGSPARYREICGGVDVLDQVRESVKLLMDSGADYEFRTTCVHPFHDPEDMTAIGRWLTGAKRYFLQNFVDSGELLGCGVSGLTEAEMNALLQAARAYIPDTQLRGI